MAGESSKNTEQTPTAAPPPALYLHPSAFSYPTAQSGVPPPAWPPGVYPPAVLPYPPPVAPGGEGTDPAAPIGYVMIPPPPPGMVYAFPPGEYPVHHLICGVVDFE
jgi:neural Wiskott-Aldrich syndrome protein